MLALALVAPAAAAVRPIVVENALAASAGRLHKASGATLASFMQQTPDELAAGLKQYLPPELLEVHVCCEDNAESGLVLSSKQRVYLGPRALGLWCQPKLLLWVRRRRKGALVTEASYIAGECSHAVELTRLSVRTRLTWVESAIDHLHGNAVPCLLMNSKLQLEIDMLKKPLLCALIPSSLLKVVCQRAVGNALANLQGAVAAALVEAYEEWCEWQAASNQGETPALA